MQAERFRLLKRRLAGLVAIAMVVSIVPAWGVPGGVITTPVTPMELPIEVEIELSPAGSLKQAPLWKELIQLLRNPYAPVVRRPGFGVDMPALNIYPVDYNFLTAQPMRLRTSDGEVSWDQPGPLFDPAETVENGFPFDAFNTPTELRTVIGELVAEDADIDGTIVPNGNLVVSNPSGHPAIPPDGTVVAVPAFFDGVLHELDPATGELEPLAQLEIPVNEEDFFRPASDTAGVPNVQLPYIGRPGAEVLGKALFWDMQVGSDGVQACGSCHFHAGADNRTRNQLNPNHISGDNTFQVKQPNEDVVATDFPFHKLADPNVVDESLVANVGTGGNVISDANDVMSSMGVSRFKQFVDIPPIGNASFGPAVNGVSPLLPDIGNIVADPIPAMDGFRRVEPRNTPTFHAAAFNLDNFWDGRARFNFNGGSVFGPSDPQTHIFIDPGNQNGNAANTLQPATNGHIKGGLEPEVATQPVRIKFSSLASQAVGPPLSDFEMSFAGRNWAKIGKKMLQDGVTPLANQLVDPTDSVLGPFSGQRSTVGGPVNMPGRPGLNVSYPQLIQLAFNRQLWHNNNRHLNGAPGTDPFDGFVLTLANGNANANNRNEFNQPEANFSMFFGLSVQAYESLTIPDDTPADRFFDLNPLAGNGVGEPGDQAVLFPTLIPDLVDDGLLNNSANPAAGVLTLIPDDPTTPEYDGFGPDEVFGFDVFAGANLTAALPAGTARNPQFTITTTDVDGNPAGTATIAVGSNPFTRSAKCMLCHLGPEQTDHSINISHGLLKNDAEFEYPDPPRVPDPDNIFGDGILPAPEPSGVFRAVGGLVLEEEIEETPQDAVEVEPRNFATFDDPATPWDDRVVAQPGNFAFGDQGIYNIGLRPVPDDIGRGGDDPFGQPLSLSALCLKNIGGPGFEPNDGPGENNVMGNFDPENIEGTPTTQGFEETGDGAFFPGTTYTLQSINPGFERTPITPLMPEYMVPWINGLPAGELHPQIDEMAGMVPNTLSPPNGGPGIEFPEIMFGADMHCATYNPDVFGAGAPNFGWGATDPVTGELVPGKCPNSQSGVAGNIDFPGQGTWPVPNRVLRDGAFKAPQLRNVEMTGPYFHTGSFLTLRQVVDFYMRGGDFPISNAENRDPHVVALNDQAFAFGRTTGADLAADVNFGFLIGTFADGLPDPVFLYNAMPDTGHPVTPEYATPEDAKVALVKFLLSLTDPRVKYERAPFDRPEIFVPIDGTAPENTGGRTALLADSRFKHVPAVGAGGNPDALPNFLGVSSLQGDPGVDHFDSIITVPVIPPPPAPTTLTAVMSSATLVALTWRDNATDETQFVIERAVNDGAFVQLSNAPRRNNMGIVHYTDSKVKAGNSYTYRVKAVNGAVSSDYSNVASVKILSKPATPNSMVATLLAGRRVGLKWRDKSTNETGFEIQRATSPMFLGAEKVLIHANRQSFTDDTIARTGTYYYRVRATNGPLASEWSNVVKIAVHIHGRCNSTTAPPKGTT